MKNSSFFIFIVVLREDFVAFLLVVAGGDVVEIEFVRDDEFPV